MNKLLKEANQMLKFWCLDADNSLEERAKKKLAEGGRIQVIAPNGDRCSVVRAGENMVQSWSEKRHQWESFPLSKCKILSVDADPNDTVSEYNAEIQRLTKKAEQLRKAGQGKSAIEVEKQIEKLGKEAHEYSKDNDATENGAIKQFGQSKQTEVMPVEKKPVLAQDASIEKIPANYRPEFPKEGYLVRYSNGMKAKWFATKEEAEAFMLKVKQEGKDCATVKDEYKPDPKVIQILEDLRAHKLTPGAADKMLVQAGVPYVMAGLMVRKPEQYIPVNDGEPVLAQDERYKGDPKYMSLPGYKQEVDRINRTHEAESKKEAEYRKSGYGKARSEEQVNGYWDNEMKSLNAHYEAKLKAGHFSKDSPEQERLQRLNNLHVYEKLKEIVEENMKRYKPDHPEYKRLAGLSKKYGDEIKRYSKDEEPVYTFGKESKEDIQKQIEKLKRIEYVDSQSEHYKPNQRNLNKIKELEKELKKMTTKDEKTYQNGEHIKIKWGSREGDLIDVKVLKDLGDKVTVKAPNGNVVDVPKIYIKDTLDECMEILRLSGVN